MRKSNDAIPEDEMLLAEAIAAAKAKRFGWMKYSMFGDENEVGLCSTDGVPDRAAYCCAYGALVVAEKAPLLYPDRPSHLRHIGSGNDCMEWTDGDADCGESLGWAFRCAMTQDEP